MLSGQKFRLSQEIEKTDLEDSVVVEHCSGEIFRDEDFSEGVFDLKKRPFLLGHLVGIGNVEGRLNVNPLPSFFTNEINLVFNPHLEWISSDC